MTYFKYIFSDKKSMPYWIILFFIIFIYTFVSVIANYEIRKPDWLSIYDFLHPFLVIVVFLGFYSVGYANLKGQEMFLKKYSNLIDKKSIKETNIVLFRESYTVKPLRHNYNAKINPKPKKDIFTTFLIENNVGLLGHTYDFGVFKRHLKPIIISLDENKFIKQYESSKIPRVALINHLDNDIEITFEESVFGIRKIRLNNWKENN
jgi:hypothetical protein